MIPGLKPRLPVSHPKAQMVYTIHPFNVRLFQADHSNQWLHWLESYEPRREKTGLRGFRPGPTQIGLYKLRKELEA